MNGLGFPDEGVGSVRLDRDALTLLFSTGAADSSLTLRQYFSTALSVLLLTIGWITRKGRVLLVKLWDNLTTLIPEFSVMGF